MSIKGLTDRESLRPRLPRLGKLRKGGAKNAKGGYGPDLDYFRFTPEPGREQSGIVEAFAELYGEKPASFHAYLPYKTLEANFPTQQEAWNGKGVMLHRCDGKVTSMILTPDGRSYDYTPQPCPGGCGRIGRLYVVLPEIIQAGYIGVFELDIKGKNELPRIAGMLALIEDGPNGTKRDLSQIEFILRRGPEKIATPGYGDNPTVRRTAIKSLVSLEPVPAWASQQLQLAAAMGMGLALPVTSTTTASGRVVDLETGEIIEQPEGDEGDDEDDVTEGEIVGKPTGTPQGGTPPPPPPVVKVTSPKTTQTAPASGRATGTQNGTTGTNGGNGSNGKTTNPKATIKTTNFAPALMELTIRLTEAGIEPPWMGKEPGTLNYDRTQYSLGARNIMAIEDANLPFVLETLEKVAREKWAEKQAARAEKVPA